MNDLPDGNATSSTSKEGKDTHRTAKSHADSKSANKFTLPPPKPAPLRVEKEPESTESFKQENPQASNAEIQAHEASIKAWEHWQDYEAVRDEVEEKGKRAGGNLSIFDGQDVSNEEEAARDWVDEMRLVIETDADQNLRRGAYECRYITLF